MEEIDWTISKRHWSSKGVEHAISLFGNFDENARIIEDGLDVRMISRDKGVRITGDRENVEKAYAVLEKLITIIEQGEHLTRQNVRYLVDLAADGMTDKIGGYTGDNICVTARGRHIKSRTHGQKWYVRAIKGKYCGVRHRSCRHGQDISCCGHGSQRVQGQAGKQDSTHPACCRSR